MRYGIVADSISIHALREEGDKRELHPRRTSRNFYPRPPRGGRPINHAILKAKFNFYPRPPRGGRPPATATVTAKAPAFLSTPSARRATLVFGVTVGICKFLSTPSARRATSRRLCAGTGQAISIHALREEGDDFFSFLCYSCTDFYPRPPRGGRLSAERTSVTSIPISIHALREEGDPVGVAAVRQQIISIHALREEGDRQQLQRLH